MIVTIKQKILDEMFTYGRAHLPNEACGILLGFRKHHSICVNEFAPLANKSKNPRQKFEINPLELLPYLKEESADRFLVGLFHTHPLASTVPSGEDLKTEWHTVPTHWIISFTDPDRPEVGCYRYLKNANSAIYHALDIFTK
jgi:proteasome lid subunit RPN8/RPN11